MGAPTEPYKTLFQASPDGILLVNEQGIVRSANPRACALLGYELGRLEGHAVEDLIPDGLRAAHRGHRARYAERAAPRPMGIGLELSALRCDGTCVPVEIALSPVETDEGPMVIATLRDLTDAKRLRDFGTGALRASEDERARIARELHDDTAQQLATLLIELRLLERTVSDEGVLGHIGRLRQGLQATADGVRRLARGLRPPELQDAGLATALRVHARSLEEGRGLAVALEVDPVDRFLTPDGQLALYRVIQEALTNVGRHSGASAAEVCVREQDGLILAEVRDSGRGFKPEDVRASGGGLGLMGMEERAAMVGGHVQVLSSPGEGTRVIVRVPVELEREVERV